MPDYYPIMLNVRGRRALVIGGDRVAAEKAAALQASGALVTVLNPQFCQELLEQERRHEITLWQKAYEPGDLAGAFVVVAATNDPALIEAIWTETEARGQLVNIVDVPQRCNFILPSILRRDKLTIAVSTEGASPGLAKRIRQQLEDLFPQYYGPYLRLAAAARAQLRLHNVSYEQRDNFFGDFFASDVLTLMAEGNEQQALTLTVELLQRYTVDIPASVLSTDMRAIHASKEDSHEL